MTITSAGEVYVGAVGIDDNPVYNVVVTREQVTHLCSAAASAAAAQGKASEVRAHTRHTHSSTRGVGWSSYREPRPALGTCVTMMLPSAPQETTCSSSVCGRKRALQVWNPDTVQSFAEVL